MSHGVRKDEVDAPPPLKRQKWRNSVLVLVIICLLILAVLQPRMMVPAMIGAVIGVFTLIRRYMISGAARQ